MVLKGLLVLASGFIFIFSPGLPMRLISRYRPDYKKEGLYWGIVIWIIAFFIGTFIQNLARQIAAGGQASSQTGTQPFDLSSYLVGAILTTLLVQIGMRIYLKNQQKKDEDVISTGLALGFGIGMITQVFTGMSLIGAGAGMVFQTIGVKLSQGTVQTGTIETISNAGFFSLLIALLAMILYRIALLTISSVQGYLVAGSLQGKPARFWLGILVSVVFTWIILFVQLLLGEKNPGQLLGVTSVGISIISAVYYLLACFLGYQWLGNELHAPVVSGKSERRKNNG
jgi:hypothetical protein